MEGSQFVQRYHVASFPHISMIDPRTGRLLWKKEGWTQENPLSAESFAEIAMDFCSRNSLDRPPQAPRPQPTSQSSSSPTQQDATLNGGTPNVDAMTEEEQLQAAVKASMEQEHQQQAVQPSTAASANDDDDEVQFLGNTAAEAAAVSGAAGAAAVPSVSWMQELWNVTVPPEAGEESPARISFRMPNGSRVVRSFGGLHPVRVVYAFVAVRIYISSIYIIQQHQTKKHHPPPPSHVLPLTLISYLFLSDGNSKLSRKNNNPEVVVTWIKRNLHSWQAFHPKIWHPRLI